MAKANYFRTVLLNHALRATSWSSPATIYVALYTDAGATTEVAGGSYARQSVTFTVPAPDSVSNTADVTFPMATADWGDIESFALLDAPSGGNMLYYATLTAPRTVLTNDQFVFPAGALQVSEE